MRSSTEGDGSETFISRASPLNHRQESTRQYQNSPLKLSAPHAPWDNIWAEVKALNYSIKIICLLLLPFSTSNYHLTFIFFFFHFVTFRNLSVYPFSLRSRCIYILQNPFTGLQYNLILPYDSFPTFWQILYSG